LCVKTLFEAFGVDMSVLNMKMGRDNLLKENGIDEEAIKKHKKCLTSLEINVPVAYKDNFIPHVVLERNNPLSDFYICKHTELSRIKRVYEELIENFDREVCDLIRTSDPDCVYLIITRLLNPGMKRSDKYRYIGFVSCTSDIIQSVWLHPFFRDHGLMKLFFIWYGTHESPIIIQPPIRPNLVRVMKKVSTIIKESPVYLEENLKLFRKYFKKNSPNAKIDQLTDINLYEVMHGITVFSACCMRDKKDFSLDKTINITTEMCIFLNNNPDKKEELEKYLENNPDISDSTDKALYEFQKYGNLKKDLLYE
jgi:hypothetical protein